MIQRFGFLEGQRQNRLRARRVRNGVEQLLVRAGSDQLLDFHPQLLQVHADLLEHVNSDALIELDQAEKQMFGAEKVVIEAGGFCAGQGDDLLSPRGEIAQRVVASKSCRYARGTKVRATDVQSAKKAKQQPTRENKCCGVDWNLSHG